MTKDEFATWCDIFSRVPDTDVVQGLQEHDPRAALLYVQAYMHLFGLARYLQARKLREEADGLDVTVGHDCNLTLEDLRRLHWMVTGAKPGEQERSP